MSDQRRGIALPVALAALVVLAALAALANLAAVAAVRESAALHAEAQVHSTRAALRARLAIRVGRVTRGALVAQSFALGAGDTVLTVTALAWPWHRVLVSAGGLPVLAELARATVPTVPWCAGVVVAAAQNIPGSLVSEAPGQSCADLVVVVPPAGVTAFDSALVADLARGSAFDTLTISGASAASGVWRAARVVAIAAGGDVSGLVVAPVVRLGAGATVHGMVVARDTLVAGPGARVIADGIAVAAALSEFAALRPLGRRGLLLPP